MRTLGVKDMEMMTYMVIWKSETMDFDALAKWNFLMSGCGHEKLGELGKFWTLPIEHCN
jgi:hypothetical protein